MKRGLGDCNAIHQSQHINGFINILNDSCKPEMRGKGSYKQGSGIGRGGEADQTQIRSWNPCMKFTGGFAFSLGLHVVHTIMSLNAAFSLYLTFHYAVG